MKDRSGERRFFDFLMPVNQIFRTQWIFYICAFVYVSLFFPGLMSEDSWSVYAQALAHSYGDHHPPLMGLLWHYLNVIYPGPALMFLVNMALLWGGIYVLAFQIMPKGWLRYVCFLLPFSPHVIDSGKWIWKDITFSFGYGLLALVVIHQRFRRTRLSLWGLLGWICLFFYASSIKYQAQFVAPILLFGLMRVQYAQDEMWRSLLKAACVSIVTLISIHQVNHMLVTQRGTGSDHSWQCVKIYDLAGISVREKTHLVPSFLWRWPDQDYRDLEKAYDLLWEPLARYKGAPLRLTRSDDERAKLLSAWRSAVWRYPLSYLKHRFYVWHSPLMSEEVGYFWFMRHFGHNAFAARYIAPTFHALHLIWFFLLCALTYPALALWALRRPQTALYGRAMLFLSLMACTLTGILFIFSLAGVVRYHYFSIYMLTLAIPFALFVGHEALCQRRAGGKDLKKTAKKT